MTTWIGKSEPGVQATCVYCGEPGGIHITNKIDGEKWKFTLCDVCSVEGKELPGEFYK